MIFHLDLSQEVINLFRKFDSSSSNGYGVTTFQSFAYGRGYFIETTFSYISETTEPISTPIWYVITSTPEHLRVNFQPDPR